MLWLKGLAEFEGMEITERVRFGSMAGSLLKQLEALHYQNREGNVDPEI